MRSFSKVVISTAIITLIIRNSGLCQCVDQVGLKFGISSASQPRVWKSDGSSDSQVKSILGLDAGIYAEWFPLSWLSVATESHFIQKGAKESIVITTETSPDGTGQYITNAVRSNFLSIMILPKIRYEIGSIQLAAFVGPRVDFSAGNTVTVDTPIPLSADYTQSLQKAVDHHKKTQFGLTLGIGLQTKALLGIATGIEFRYSPNLQDATSNEFFRVYNTSMEVLLALGW